MIRYTWQLIAFAVTVCSQTVEYDIPASPCPDVFVYESLETNDQPLAKRWYGVIKLYTDVTLHALWLNVILDSKADILGNWIGEVTTKDNINFKIENDNMTIIPGEPKVVRFFVQYSPEDKPELKSILFNGREICKLSEAVTDDKNTNPYQYELNNGASADTIANTVETIEENKRKHMYNGSQTKSQNKQTLITKPNNYYIQTTTEKIISSFGTTEKNSAQILHTINKAQLVSDSTRWPQNTAGNYQQPIKSLEKTENKTESTQNNTQHPQIWPHIKATVYQQALSDRLPNSTSSYSHVSFGSTKLDNGSQGISENKPHVINSDKTDCQQLQRDDDQPKLGSLQTTTVKSWSAVSALKPNIQNKPNHNSQDNSGNTHIYSYSNNCDDEQNLDTNTHNNRQYLSEKQYSVSDSLKKDFTTKIPSIASFQVTTERPNSGSFQITTNRQQGRPIEPLPIMAINTAPHVNDERLEEPINRQQTETASTSQRSSELGYEDSGSQLDKDDVIHPFIGLPIYTQTEETCGRVIKMPPQILPYGSTTSEGQWPWQAALYQQQTVHFKYICGGTLVSHSHVITAAHCVTRRVSMRPVNKLTLTVYLGKFNLRTSVEGVQVKFVNEIIVHPEYNSTTFSRDLAILELRDSATFTELVRPVCLWPEVDISLSSIVGKIGSVVGWGVESFSLTKGELTLLEMPIVDQQTCINSYNFYERHTSAYTYCARYNNDNKVCNSDSGGGMVLKKQNTWYLRGVLSVSVASQMEYLCDSKRYIIFTDIAKFLPWIMEHIDL